MNQIDNTTTSFLPELSRLITTSFDLEELRNLCFDLAIDYETLRGESKTSKIRELILFLARRNRLRDMLPMLRKLRPHITWPPLPPQFSLAQSLLTLPDDLETLQEQLAFLKLAQSLSNNPWRFQLAIEDSAITLANWEKRFDNQLQRISDGLDIQRQQVIEGRRQFHRRHRLPSVGQPPLDVTHHFKDRLQEYSEVGRLLTAPNTRLVSILGRGGMGKTALACKVLRDMEFRRSPYINNDSSLNGIVYLSTRTKGINLTRLFLDCAKLLDDQTEKELNAIWTNPSLETPVKISHLFEAFGEGSYAILLDNFEDLLDEDGRLIDTDLQTFFEQCLNSSHCIRLLLTSRISLILSQGNRRFDQQVILQEGLPTDEGVALLRELDPNGHFGLRDATEEQLNQAVLLVHGVPRALEVIAGILANDPFAALADILTDFYVQEDVVQMLIEENYKRLDNNARRVLEALAVFSRPIPPLGVDFLLEPFVPGLDVPNILRRLTHTNIVNVDRVIKTVTLHPIDQDYAYSQLSEDNRVVERSYNRLALERRAADYYLRLRTPPDTWSTIDDLQPQLVEFEHRFRAGDYDDACKILDLIDYNYLYLWGHYSLLVNLREKINDHLTDPICKVANLGALGLTYRAQGGESQIKHGIKLIEEALEIAREIEDLQSLEKWLGQLGDAYRVLGQIDVAIKYFEKALSIARGNGNSQGEGVWLGTMALAYRSLGHTDHAITLLKKALYIHREVGIRWRECLWLGQLGHTYYDLGKVKFAIELLDQALIIARETGDRRRESSQISQLGKAYHAAGQLEQAIEYYKQSLTTAREIGDRLTEAHDLIGLSRVLIDVGSLLKAQQYCTKALTLEVPETNFQAALIMGIALLRQRDPNASDAFISSIEYSRAMLDKTANLYEPRYALATALVGNAVCSPQWPEESKRTELITPALTCYRQAMGVCDAPGVVRDALEDLKRIQKAGVGGLEAVFGLLEAASVNV